MLFGSASCDITPDRPMWMAGYFGRRGPSTGVSEPLLANCIAVQSGADEMNGGDPVLLVTLDLIGLHEAEARQIVDQIANAIGVSSKRILIACSHTHYAPSMGLQRIHNPEVGQNGLNEPDHAYLCEMTAKVIHTCGLARERLTAGTVEVLHTRAPHVHFNRRVRQYDGTVQTNFLYPDATDRMDESYEAEKLLLSPTDDRLTAVRFRSSDTGIVGAVLIHFACHTVTGDQHGDSTSLLISSDYVHYLREELHEEYQCPILFMQGSAGDVVPLRRLGDARKWIGTTLAHAVLLGERAFRPMTVDQLAVNWGEVDVSVRYDIPRNPGKQLTDAARRLLASPDDCNNGPERASYIEALNLAYAAIRWPGGSFVVRIQQIRLGSLSLVALPFEVLSELGLRVKKSVSDALIVSYANGYEGYLPFRSDFDAGGYESQVGSAHFDPGTAERVLKAVLILLNETASD